MENMKQQYSLRHMESTASLNSKKFKEPKITYLQLKLLFSAIEIK
jgi:hypothetical protein